MKRCSNCGATIRDGDTFCRTCAMPVTQEEELPTQTNVATSGFIRPTKQDSGVKPPIQYTETTIKQVDPYQSDVENKDRIRQDGNDRLKATLFNFLGLLVLLLILWFIGNFIYHALF